MISPHTPPGTKVVCINDKGSPSFIAPVFRHLVDPNGSSMTVVLGEVYTVAEIIRCGVAARGFAVALEERDPEAFYYLDLFRPAELPKSITDLLNVQPKDVDALVEAEMRQRLRARREVLSSKA